MERWQVVTAILFVYLALTLTIGLMSGRKASKGVTGFVAGDRDFGLLVMYFVTGASVFSAFAFLGGPGWAYSRGAAAFYILAYGVLGIIPWYWVGPKVAATGRNMGFVTQAQLITGRFPSRPLSILIAVLSIAAFIPYITLQMRGAGIVIESVTEGHIPLWMGAALAYGIVIIYVLTSGVAAVGWTNTFQGIFMVIIAWTLGLYLPHRIYGGIGPMFDRIITERPELLTLPGLTSTGAAWSWGGFSSAILVSAIGISMWPHLFMKAFTARDSQTIRRTVMLFPTFQLFLIPIFLIGFAGVFFIEPGSIAGPDFVLPEMILRTDLPALVVGLFCAGALSASMSTGDALLHAAASVAVEDGVGPLRKLTDKAATRLIRILIVVLGVVAYIFALDEDSSLVVLLLTSYGIIAQLAPPVIAALYWPRATTAGAVSGLVAGAASAIFFYANPALRIFDLHEGLLALGVHLVVLIGVSLATPAQDKAHVDAFLTPEGL